MKPTQPVTPVVTPPRASRVPFMVSALLLLLTALYVWPRLRVTSDVTLLLPEGGDREALAVWSRVADSELSRSMVLLIGAPDVATAAEASRAFERALHAEPRVQAQLAPSAADVGQ